MKLERCLEALCAIRTLCVTGRVTRVVGTVLESIGPVVSMGDLCLIELGDGQTVRVEVVGFSERRVLLMPMGRMVGIRPGCRVLAPGGGLRVGFSEQLLGRILDGLGQPLDRRPLPPQSQPAPVDAAPPCALERRPIREIFETGIRAIDGLLTLGKGQRIGLFSGSGVGKSTLMGMMARASSADVNVIALVGERGREVRDFITRHLGEEGLRRSVVVAATSDQPALVRIKAALLATALAEAFRDQGKDVCLMMDSVTRVAMAQREIGLAVGEPPTSRGYTPSVFALLPRLLERAGASSIGSVTGVYTVLVDGDDLNEPVADAVRGILDGHVVLSRELAHRNHYPAVDVLGSVSRLMGGLVSPEHRAAAGRIRAMLSTLREAHDLVSLGAYRPGSSPEIDHALERRPALDLLLKQSESEHCPMDVTLEGMRAIGAGLPQ